MVFSGYMPSSGIAGLYGSSIFSFFFLIYFILSIYLIFGCIGSSLLHAGSLQLLRVGATLCCGAQASHCGAQASHCGGLSCCGAQAPGTWASALVAHGL